MNEKPPRRATGTDHPITNRGVVLWLTGLPGAGKSTIASGVEDVLRSCDVRVVVLDGDVVRRGLCADLGFSRSDRAENVRRVAEVAALLALTGVVCVVALVSPFAEDRARARAQVRARGIRTFAEVFVDAPPECCESRDPKGMYAKARAGQLHQFTGVSDPYEAPPRPEIHLRTSVETVDECVQRVVAFVSAAVEDAGPDRS